MVELINTGPRPEGGYDRLGRAFIIGPGESRVVDISPAYEQRLRRRAGALRLKDDESLLPPVKLRSGTRGGAQDDDEPPKLTDIKGIGEGIAGKLAALEITTVEQIAVLTPEQVTDLNVKLNFRGDRIGRDEWVEQAKVLVGS